MKKEKTVISFCIALPSFLLMLMTLLLVTVSCTEYKFDDTMAPRETDVMISIRQRTVAGRAERDNDRAQTRVTENEIKSAVVLIYNASRVFEKSSDMGTGSPVTLTLREGKKYIFIVANACPALRAKLDASPSYQELTAMLSEAADYNAGNYPAQGLLMSGQTEQTIAVGSANSVQLKLKYCMSRVDLYLRKGSADVGNITVSSVKLLKARNRGYLFKPDMYASTVTNTVALQHTQVTGYTTGSDGTLIGTQYTYPTVDATDLAFEIGIRHAGTSAADTYTVYLNAGNTAAHITLKPNIQYKVIVTFSKDESGTLLVSAFTEKVVNFDIG